MATPPSGRSAPTKRVDVAWILDLDGVVWLGEEHIPGAAAAVARLRRARKRILFLTNNSSVTVAAYVAKLAAHGIAIDEGEVATSAQAAASLVAPGARVMVCAGPGVVEAL